MKGPRYPIRAVSRLTGLGIDTLRAWERRYQAVEPVRDDRGRMYTESDVQRLHLLRAAVDKGHAIGRVATLSEKELRTLLDAKAPAPAETASSEVSGDANPRVERVLARIRQYDEAGADLELRRLAALMSTRELIVEVAMPLMRTVGMEWHAAKLRIAQEHMASALMRSLLGSLLRMTAPKHSGKTLLFTTPEGEHHEFGTLAAAMLASAGGLGVIYLGPDLPNDEIVHAATETGVAAVVLGITEANDTKETISSLKRLRKGLPRKIELWAGGTASEKLIPSLQRVPLVWIDNFDTLDQQLSRLGARQAV